MADEPVTIQARGKVKPTCPRCGSTMILIGRLTDALGHPVQFSVTDAEGFSATMGTIRSCYCNDCGEVTLTLE